MQDANAQTVPQGAGQFQELAQRGKGVDHLVAAFVNDLARTAELYAGTQQLRERLRGVVANFTDPLLRANADMRNDLRTVKRHADSTITKAQQCAAVLDKYTHV